MRWAPSSAILLRSLPSPLFAFRHLARLPFFSYLRRHYQINRYFVVHYPLFRYSLLVFPYWPLYPVLTACLYLPVLFFG